MKTEDLYLAGSNESLKIGFVPQDVILCGRMVFKTNGDIELDGRKLTNDLEIVNALRTTFELPTLGGLNE